ncbi:MAG: hypothetical protein Q9195_005823 [Heterodermia aff. obscurata]
MAASIPVEKQRNLRACIFCRQSRKKCSHPAKNGQPGECNHCLARGLPCGPYELAEESLEYLKKQVPRPTLPQSYPLQDDFNYEEHIRANNVGQTDTSNTYDGAANIPSSQDTSLQSGTSDVLDSAVGASAPPLAQQDLRTKSIDQTDEYFEQYINYSAESYMAVPGAGMTPPPLALEEHRGYISTCDRSAESDRGNMSPFVRYDQIRLYQEHIETLKRDRPAQNALDRISHHASEWTNTELDRAVNKMVEMWHQAQDSGNTDQARWMCPHVMRAITYSSNAMEQKREEFLRALAFYKGTNDVVEADRIFQIMLQHGLLSTTTVPKAAELYTNPFGTPLGHEIVDENSPGNILPDLHRQIELGFTALNPLLQNAAASGVTPISDFYGRTLLHVAAEKGLVKLLELLLNLGTHFPKFKLNIEARDEAHRTPLHLTIHKGHESAYRFLRKRGAKLGRNHTGYSPLASAASGGHIRMIEDMFEAK